jgi:hypothetical protein
MLMAGDLYHTVDEWAPTGGISEHGIAKPLPSCYTFKTVIQGPDQFGGWKMLEAEPNTVTTWSIPKHHGNVLGIINSKIM